MGIIIMFIVIAVVGGVIRLVIQLAANGVTNTVENKRVSSLNSNVNKLEEDWNTRVKQLGIDLEKAVRVKYYTNYYADSSDTKTYSYFYYWPVAGAMAYFDTIYMYDKNGNRRNITSSPLEWNIKYDELKDIRGVYQRGNVCIIQYDDTSLGFPAEEYEKIKKVYNEAKAMDI